MKVLVATDIHVHIHDAKKYLAKQVFHIIERYHNYFGEVILYCREDRNFSKEELILADGVVSEHVGFSSLFGTMFGKEKRLLDQAIQDVDLVIGRFHSFAACEAAVLAQKNGKPFLAEVMGDAWDGYWNHGLTGKLIAPIMYFRTKTSVNSADYGLYVTENYLQKKYPCKGKSINASNVELSETPNSVFEQRISRIRNMDKTNICLMTAANVDVRAKGHEYVIKAMPLLRDEGINVTYNIAGGGDNTYLREIAEKYGVSDNVVFLGRLRADEVKAQMDCCDIYVQPSLQEGLPRSVIEAMSRACPCCGARTAGIPELLQPGCIFRRASERDLAKVIIKMLEQDLEAIAKENFEHSKEYLTKKLNLRRETFFHEIRQNVQKKH